MPHQANPDPPKLAKAHSDYVRDLYVAVGWTVVSTFRDDKGEAYEYLLAWKKEGLPVSPRPPSANPGGGRQP